MRLTRGIARFVVPVVMAAFSLGGCIKFKQNAALMPDGSGKMTFSIGFNEKGVKEAASSMGQGDGMVEDPTEDFADFDNMHGFVAFTKPVMEEKDGWKHVTFTGYFEDINKVKVLEDGEEEAEQVGFAFRKTETGYALTVNSSFKQFGEMGDMGDMGDASDAPPEMKEMMEQMKKLMESMLAGFEFSQGFTMPGVITKAEGVTSKEGRTAMFFVDGEKMKDPKEAAKLAEKKEFVIECGASEVSEAELVAFKEEMAKAKAEWEKWKAEMKKAEEEEPSDDGDDGEDGDDGGDGDDGDDDMEDEGDSE
jgi:hypothetical protein